MRKATIIHSRQKGASNKLGLIGAIIKFSKLANERFGIEILTFDELNKMDVDNLKNLYTALRVQLKIPRKIKTIYWSK